MRYTLGLLFLIRFFSIHVVAQPDPYVSGGVLIPEQAAFDVGYYSLSLKIDPKKEAISGSLSVIARITSPIKRFVLDLDPRLSIRQISEHVGGQQVERRFHREGGQVWIELVQERLIGEQVTLTIRYGGIPRVAPIPPWAGGFTWSRTNNDRYWVATSCQTEGADVWWPVKDHPSDKPDSMDVRFNVPKGYWAVSNGKLVSRTPKPDKTETFHWKISVPISPYNVTLNIAPYLRITHPYTTIDGVTMPIQYWVLPENVEKGKVLLVEMAKQLAFLEQKLGPYPFRSEKFGIAETPFLGMEHQTLIAYGGRYKNDAMTGYNGGFDALLFHETAHEWFGNLITNHDWKDMWLHEAFATYLEALYAEYLKGTVAYRVYLNRQEKQIDHAAALAPLAPISSKDVPTDVYNKGSWVLHSLRYLMGDEPFFRLLKAFVYPQTKAGFTADPKSYIRFVDTDAFIRLANEISQKDLGWFFEVYLREAKPPTLHITRTRRYTDLAWHVPGQKPFPMPLEVFVEGKLERVSMEGGHARIWASENVSFVVDPERWVLRGKDEYENRYSRPLSEDDLVGRYIIQPEFAFEVWKSDGKLLFRAPGSYARELNPINERQFEVQGGDAEVMFEVDDRQEVNQLLYKRDEVTMTGTRMDFVIPNQFYRLKLPIDLLERYVGRFRVGDAPQAADIVISRTESRLLLQEGGNPPIEIFPITESLFEWKLLPAQIQFLENEKEEVYGLRIDRGTVSLTANKR